MSEANHDESRLLAQALEACKDITGGALGSMLGSFIVTANSAGWTVGLAGLSGGSAIPVLGVASIFGITKAWISKKSAAEACRLAEQIRALLAGQRSVLYYLEQIAHQEIGVTLDTLTQDDLAARVAAALADTGLATSQQIERLRTEMRQAHDDGAIFQNEADLLLREICKDLRTLLAALRDIDGGLHLGEATSVAAAYGPIPQKLHPPRNLPSRNEKFAGRAKELEDIHSLLSRDVAVGVTQQTAAHGLGGVGKTSVALEYAWQHLDDYPGGILYVSCDTDLLVPAIAGLAQSLGIQESESQEKTAERVKEALEAGAQALLILDNVRGPDQWTDARWSKWLPAGPCRRLVTTRSPRLPNVSMYQIDQLSRPEGINLLGRHRVDATTPENEGVVGDIVDWLDGLAVALTAVGVYMAMHPDLSWARYCESLQGKGLGALRATEGTAGLLPDYHKRVDTVFDETLAVLSAPELRALEYAALLPEDAVDRRWIAWLLENDQNVQLPAQPGYENKPAEPVISRLLDRQLLRPLQDHVLAFHRVFRRRLNELLDEEQPRRDELLNQIAALALAQESAAHKIRASLKEKVATAVHSLAEPGSCAIPRAHELENWYATVLLRPLQTTPDGRKELADIFYPIYFANFRRDRLYAWSDWLLSERLFSTPIQIDTCCSGLPILWYTHLNDWSEDNSNEGLFEVKTENRYIRYFVLRHIHRARFVSEKNLIQDRYATDRARAEWPRGIGWRMVDQNAYDVDMSQNIETEILIPIYDPLAVRSGRAQDILGVANFEWDQELSPTREKEVSEDLSQRIQRGRRFPISRFTCEVLQYVTTHDERSQRADLSA